MIKNRSTLSSRKQRDLQPLQIDQHSLFRSLVGVRYYLFRDFHPEGGRNYHW
jgi:hypothetical protein